MTNSFKTVFSQRAVWALAIIGVGATGCSSSPSAAPSSTTQPDSPEPSTSQPSTTPPSTTSTTIPISSSGFTLVISNKDSDGSALLGGVRTSIMWDSDGDGSFDSSYGAFESLADKPTVITNVPPGSYRITEIEVPPGYISGGSVIVNASSGIQRASLANKRLVEPSLATSDPSLDIGRVL